MKKGLKFALFFLLGIFIVWWFVKDLDATARAQILQSFRDANYGIVGIALIIGALSFIIRTLRWKMQMETMGYYPKKRNTLMAVMSGYVANLAVPRLGEVLRCGLLNRYEKIPIAKSLGTVITERALDMLCFFFLFVLSMLVQWDLIRRQIFDKMPDFTARFSDPDFLSSLLLWGLLFFALAVALLVWIRLCFWENKWVKKVRQLFLQLWEGLISLKDIKKPWLFVFYTIGLWLCYFVMAYVVFFSLPETSHLPMSSGLACLVFGTVGMIVTPGGLGLYPVIIAETLMVYGVSQPIGFAMGWLIWTSQNVMIVVGGLLSIVLFPVLNGGKEEL